MKSDVQTGKSPPNPSSKGVLELADQFCLLALWGIILWVCGWLFLSGQTSRPIDFDGAPPIRSSYRIDPNLATTAQLSAIPGIGGRVAAAIVAERSQHGPFSTIEDLERVNGIGLPMIQQMKPFLYLDGEQGAEKDGG